MKKGLRNLLIVGGLGIGAYLLYKKFGKRDQGNEGSEGNDGGSTTSSCVNPVFKKKNNNSWDATLEFGEDSTAVKTTQVLINRVASKIGVSRLTEDGKFGCATKAAIQKLLGSSSVSPQQVKNKVQSME